MSNLKKFFTVAVTALTVVAQAGFVVLAPMAARAAVTPGTLVKTASNPAVYFYGQDGRYVFSTKSTYDTWYTDFSGVVTISSAEMGNLQLVAPVPVRAGTVLVKTTSVPTVYAVEPGGVLRAISSESVAAALYGSLWYKNVIDIGDTAYLLYNRTSGSAITSNVHPTGTVIKYANSSAVYYIQNGAKRQFASEAALAANKINSKYILTTSITYPDGAAITGMEPAIASIDGVTQVVQPPVNSAVSASLSSDTPASRSVVTAEAGADLAHFTFTGTGSVTSVSLKRIGVSQDSSFLNVYLYDGSTRLTDAASVSSGSMVTFNDPSGLFSVAGSKVISVKADMNASSGETIGVQLTGFTAGGVTTTLATPLSGSLMSVATATLAAVSFGAVTPSANSSLTPANDVIVWQSTASVTTRDVQLSHFTIREVGGVARTDLANLRFMVDGTLVGTVANPDVNGYSTFVPATPLTLTTGSHVFKVMADVKGGSSLSFTFSIRNKTDIGLIDSQYKVGLLTSTAIGSLTGFQQTVATGYVTVQKSTDSPSSTVVLAGTDAVLARYTAQTYGENVKADTLLVDFTYSSAGSNAAATIRNGRVLIDGQQVGSTTTISSASTGTSFNINHTFMAGTTAIIEVRGDVYDNDGTGSMAANDTLLVFLGTGVNNAQGKVSGTATLDVPSADVNGNTLTVGSGSLTLAKDQSYGNQSVVVPTTASLLGSWSLTSGTSEAINLDTIQVDLTFADEFAAADLANVYVMYGTKKTSSKATVSATAGANTWSISESMPANSSLTFKVYGDVATGAVVTTTAADTVIPSLLVSGTTPSGTAVNTNSNAVLAGQTITALTSGTLTVSLDSNTPVAAQAVAGSTPADGALKVKLAASNEDMYVKKLTIYVNTSANSAAVASMNLAWATTSNGTYTTVGTDQTAVNDGTNPAYATWNLSGSTRVAVPKNGTVYLKVTPTYVSSGQTAVTGLTPKLFVGEVQAEGTSTLSAGNATGTLINTTGIIVQANSSATYVSSTETKTAAAVIAAATTLPTANGQTFLPGDVIFIDADAESDWDPATEELMIVLADGGANLTVKRGVFGTTAVAYDNAADTIYRLSTATMTTAAGIVGNAQTVLNTKLSLALKSDTPSGAFTGGTGKYLFGVTASAANNSADPATNTGTITYFDVTVSKSAASVANLKAYPAEYDNNSTYATTCVGISSTVWRCTLSSTGNTNQVDENSSRSYTFRGDLGYSGAGSVDFSIAALGTSSTSTNSVYWTDGTTAQYWVNQPTTVIQGGSLTTTAASGTRDQTAPTISSIVFTDGTADNALTVGATIVITFSEMMDPTTIGPSTMVPGGSAVAVTNAATGDIAVAANNGAASGNDMLTITNIVNVDLGATTFATGALTGAVTAALNSAGTVLTLTVTTAMTGAGADGTEIIEPGSVATTVTDVNGTAATAAGSNSATVTGVDL